MPGPKPPDRRRFWTAGGLRPADLTLLRSALSDELPPQTPEPSLVILCGLPGTGKSHFARKLAQRAPFLWLNSDRIRKALVAQPSYSRREHRRVFAAMHVLTHGYLCDGYSVVFDATNLNENVRAPLYSIAADAGVDPIIIRFTASPGPGAPTPRRPSIRSGGRGPKRRRLGSLFPHGSSRPAGAPPPHPGANPGRHGTGPPRNPAPHGSCLVCGDDLAL